MLDPRNGSHQREISVSNLATIDFVRLCACGGKFGARAQEIGMSRRHYGTAGLKVTTPPVCGRSEKIFLRVSRTELVRKG